MNKVEKSKNVLIELDSPDNLPTTKRRGRGVQKNKRWNIKFTFDGKTLINEDFTTLSQISKKFGVSYNTLRSLSCGRCKQKDLFYKNITLTKLN